MPSVNAQTTYEQVKQRDKDTQTNNVSFKKSA